MTGLDPDAAVGGVGDVAGLAGDVVLVHGGGLRFDEFGGKLQGERGGVRGGDRLPFPVRLGGLGAVGPVADAAHDRHRRATQVSGLGDAGTFHLDGHRVVVGLTDPFGLVGDTGVLHDLTGGDGTQ